MIKNKSENECAVKGVERLKERMGRVNEDRKRQVTMVVSSSPSRPVYMQCSLIYINQSERV